MQDVIITGTHDICTNRGWRIHAIGFEPNHTHLLISWHGFFECEEVRGKLKNLLSLFLGRLADVQGRHWFTDLGSRKRVTTRKHFDYLIQTYIPKHSQQKWFEGDSLPPIPPHILHPPKNSPQQDLP